MMHGVLIINLEPSYIGFRIHDSSSCWRDCTPDEIRSLLVDLEILDTSSHWPLKELIMRLPGSYSKDILTKYGLIDRMPAA